MSPLIVDTVLIVTTFSQRAGRTFCSAIKSLKSCSLESLATALKRESLARLSLLLDQRELPLMPDETSSALQHAPGLGIA